MYFLCAVLYALMQCVADIHLLYLSIWVIYGTLAHELQIIVSSFELSFKVANLEIEGHWFRTTCKCYTMRRSSFRMDRHHYSTYE